MERNGQRGAITNLSLLLLAAVVSFSIGRYTQTFTGQVASFTMGFGVILALVSVVQMRLEEQERLEQLEFEEVTHRSSGTSIFNTGSSEAFPARRSREMFERFFVPIFSGLLALGQGVAAFYCGRWLNRPGANELRQPLLGLGLFGGLFIVLFLVGQYSTGVARLGKLRLLRPSGNLLLLAAYLAALTTGVLGASVAEFPRMDLYAARGVCVLLGLLAMEGFISVLLDLYRPRVQGKVAHPLYDSRLVGLLSHPEGVFSTAATALDYQFGFKVSDTWFYQFLRRSLGWLLLGQIALLLICTCIVFISPGEQALLERMGKPVAGRGVLDPGLHLKLPWPIDDVRRYRTQEIQSLVVGGIPDETRRDEIAFLWTVSHYKEEFNLVVPSRNADAQSDVNGPTGNRNVPLSFLTVSIPIHYQISDLEAFVYNYENGAAVLEQLADREVALYFANTEINQLMSEGQSIAAERLRERLQARIDEMKLGVKLLFVGLQDIHPPAAVAADYEAVVSARQWKETNRLDALAFAASTNVQAAAKARLIIIDEGARATNQVRTSLARAARFTNQLVAFKTSPEVYGHRTVLQSYTNAVAGAQKVLIGSTNTHNVIQLDLQKKYSTEFIRQLAPSILRK